MSSTPSTAVLVIVGAGPRATGLLERIAANARELWDGSRELRIHLVDPHPPGPGRIWRHEQSALLRMNSMAEDVTMFTDESSTIEGPVRPGPSLAEWAAQFSGRGPRHTPYAEPADPEVLAELRTLTGADFPTRRAQSAYLDWVFRRTLTELPPSVTVEWHRTTATAVTGPPDGPQYVHLADRATPLTADLVVLAQGHLGSTPTAEHRDHAAFALRHGRFHLSPEFSADADLSGLRPGEHVLLRGFGLAFIDLMTLLTEGRGGTYRTEADGTLTYLPSGREPVLHVGSRRGVPYHSKTRYRLQGPRPPLPRHFGPEAVDALLAEGRPLDLRCDVWPLMAKEIGFGHYHELFHAHPERTALPWADFIAAYDRLGWYDDDMAALVATAVPDPADRLDFEVLDHPLDGLAFPTADALQEHLREHIAEDVARREDPEFSADLGAFLALLSVYGQLPRLVAAGRLTARSVAERLDGWWHGFFSFLASGPPGFRLRQLLALSRAGIVHFLGADVRIGTDESTGTFTATSSTVPGHISHATALIEAYLPGPSLDRTEDPLLRDLHRTGALTEEVITDPTHTHRSGLLAVSPAEGHLVDPSLGSPHPRRIALGAPTNSRAVAAFARPRTNAPAFRQNDAVARVLLRALSTTEAGTATSQVDGPSLRV
ncbi:FAD/NAD(P)-binding protein [Streptomyces coeruleorubidus]|uniref:Adenylate cyclase n=1 Tax=Streptomyces coeruleorubidus TaxID=116188 RepID=A0A5J6HX27_STRC4|nr:FAD/NAD(P)-binding protein [Streptomyces coeruleorubidus]QEV23434.1 adenylate cyclase [Streptomyces coeruleorubidus]GGT97582.1 adenylate cyclase [Streptomyces coeruleorubidus]